MLHPRPPWTRPSERVAAYARASLSPATWRAYQSQLRAWEAWCRARSVAAMPASPVLVANHLAELASVRSHSTLTGRLDALTRAHAFMRLAFDRADPAIRQTLSGITRTHGTRPKRQAAPLLTADVVRIASACGGDCREIGGQAATAISGYGSLAAWNLCPKPEPSVPL